MSGNLLSGCSLICGFQIPEENRNNLLEALYGGKKMCERSLSTLRGRLAASWANLLNDLNCLNALNYFYDRRMRLLNE